MRQFLVTALVCLLSVGAWTYAQGREQSCAPGSCAEPAAEPFTHVYVFGFSGAAAAGGWLVSAAGNSLTGSNGNAVKEGHPVLRSGSITAIGCDYAVAIGGGTDGNIDFIVHIDGVAFLTFTTTPSFATDDRHKAGATYSAGVEMVNAGTALTMSRVFTDGGDRSISDQTCYFEVTGFK